MTDDELTALAAKAYGNAPTGFSPLTDDGDALRLAVKLMIDIRQFLQYRGVVDALVDRLGFGRGESIGDDPYAATRRAIVRAAAEIAVRAHPKQHNDGGADE